MGVLVVIHAAGDHNRLAQAYERHSDGVWSHPAECRAHVAARMTDGLLIADEWVSEAGFRSGYVGSAVDAALAEAGDGAPRIHVATIMDRSVAHPTTRSSESEVFMDDEALADRVVPRDS